MEEGTKGGEGGYLSSKVFAARYIGIIRIYPQETYPRGSLYPPPSPSFSSPPSPRPSPIPTSSHSSLPWIVVIPCPSPPSSPALCRRNTRWIASSLSISLKSRCSSISMDNATDEQRGEKVPTISPRRDLQARGGDWKGGWSVADVSSNGIRFVKRLTPQRGSQQRAPASTNNNATSSRGRRGHAICLIYS